MTSQYDYDGYGRRRGSGVFLAIVLSLVVGATLLGVFVHRARSGWPGRIASAIAGHSLIVVSAPEVVDRIQRLSRLETVKYSLDTVVEGDESNPLLPDALAGDKLLMIVQGSTVAGVDLSQLLRRRQSVLAGDTGAGQDLAGQARDPHHVEFVEVGFRDREKTQPLQQRMVLVIGLGQNALVEG